MIIENKVKISTAKKTDVVSDKVLELRKKIHDNDYIDNAVQRIAQVISRRLVENTLQARLWY